MWCASTWRTLITALCVRKKKTTLEKHFVVLCCDFIFILGCCWNLKAKKSRARKIFKFMRFCWNFFSGVHKQLRNFMIQKILIPLSLSITIGTCVSETEWFLMFSAFGKGNDTFPKVPALPGIKNRAASTQINLFFSRFIQISAKYFFGRKN